MALHRLSGWTRFMLIWSAVVVALGILLFVLYPRLFPSPDYGTQGG